MTTLDPNKALVIFSGGQDSTTCLGWAKNRFAEVRALCFFYGQKHEVEIGQARLIAESLEVPLHEVDISFYRDLVHSALTQSDGDMNQQHEDNENLPASFVPNRNALFTLLAHSWAQTTGAGHLVAGFCQTDYSGYPDCREPFVNAVMQALNLGSDQNITMHTPLMHLTKAQTFELAEAEGVLELVVKESHTCYNGVETMNPWGRGCGDCPACELRRRGYEEFTQGQKQNP